LGSAHQTSEVAGAAGITTEEAVMAQLPEIPRLDTPIKVRSVSNGRSECGGDLTPKRANDNHAKVEFST